MSSVYTILKCHDPGIQYERLAYPLRTRHIEELVEEHVVNMDHATSNRWIIKYRLQIEEEAYWRIGYAWPCIDADPQP